MLFQHLGERLFLHCVDQNDLMLAELKGYLRDSGVRRFAATRAPADDLPITTETLDCVLTFNAIHDFPLSGFLRESHRVLKDGGYLFIYTRTRTQNQRSVWGRHFPRFAEKESRLYEDDELATAIGSIGGFHIETVRRFSQRRVASMDRLLEQSEHRHYSTFGLYSDEELERSREQFVWNLRKCFPNTRRITWYDENLLVVARRHPIGDGRRVLEWDG